MASRLVGRLLSGVCAGERRLAWNDAAVASARASIVLTSPLFKDGGLMPQRCAGEGVGDNVSPALAWSGVPDGAAELVLIMEDPDVPLWQPLVHMIAHGIAPTSTGLAEGELSAGASKTFRFGTGAFGRQGYHGPRPVPGHGAHRYIFTLLALAPGPSCEGRRDLAATLAAAAGRVLAKGKLTGCYER